MLDTNKGLKSISGDFFTSIYRITGNVKVSASGLIGLLNDKIRSTVSIEESYLSYINQPGTIADYRASIYIAKTAFEVIALNKRELVGPEAMVRGGFGRTVQHQVLITTALFEVRGYLEVPGQLEPDALFAENIGRYLAVYSATAVMPTMPEIKYSGEAILINQKRVEFISGEKR